MSDEPKIPLKRGPWPGRAHTGPMPDLDAKRNPRHRGERGPRASLATMRREDRFVDRILLGERPALAFLAAGWRASTDRIAASGASAALRRPRVHAALVRARELARDRHTVTEDKVIHELARIGLMDIRQIFTPEGHLKDIANLSADEAAAIAGIEIVTRQRGGKDQPVEYVHKIKLADKTAALALLCRHLGLLHDKVEVTATIEQESEGQLMERLRALIAKAE